MKNIKKYIPVIAFLVMWIVIYWISYPLRPFNNLDMVFYRILSFLFSCVASGFAVMIEKGW